jgi:hypothetical protein
MLSKKMMFRLAVAAADAYQFAGRHDSPELLMDFFYWLSRALDPTKVPPDCINPAMLQGISKSIGIPMEKLLEEDDDGHE